jgi:F0F1-type ATP synthase assembly protein I
VRTGPDLGSAARVRTTGEPAGADSVSVAMEQRGQARQAQVYGHAAGMNEGMHVLSYLLAGVALYGGIGWLADRLLGTGFWLPVGIVLGAAVAVYAIIRRFGRVDDTAAGTITSTTKATTGEGAR